MQMTVKALPQLVRMLEPSTWGRFWIIWQSRVFSDGPPYAAAADVFRLADYQICT